MEEMRGGWARGERTSARATRLVPAARGAGVPSGRQRTSTTTSTEPLLLDAPPAPAPPAPLLRGLTGGLVTCEGGEIQAVWGRSGGGLGRSERGLGKI